MSGICSKHQGPCPLDCSFGPLRVPTDAAVVIREDFKPNAEVGRRIAEQTRTMLAEMRSWPFRVARAKLALQAMRDRFPATFKAHDLDDALYVLEKVGAKK